MTSSATLGAAVKTRQHRLGTWLMSPLRNPAHVARVSRGAAGMRRHPLESLGNVLQHTRHGKAPRPSNAPSDYQVFPGAYWWPRPDSNRHSGFPEADFKSAVSTVPPRGPRVSVPAPLAPA